MGNPGPARARVTGYEAITGRLTHAFPVARHNKLRTIEGDKSGLWGKYSDFPSILASLNSGVP